MRLKDLFEISQVVAPDGRRRVKFALHEIYPDESKCNINGITYLEEYCRNNAESIVGMPLCAAFLDDEKEVPYDHGLTGSMGNMPLFEDSVQVGSADGWEIADVEIDGEIHRVMVACGYINQQRYPKLVEWLEKRQADGIATYGSVEFVGTPENGEIIYKDGKSIGDKYRVPIEYVYSGYCILTVKPSDSSAIMLELNQAKQDKEDKEKMDEIKKLLEALMERLDETNACKSRIEQNEAELANGRATIEELTAARDAVLAERDEAWKKIEVMHEEIEMLQEAIAKAEVERKLSEYNAAMQTYSDEEKKVVSEEMAKFEADPVGCGIEVNQITEKIEAAAYRKMKEQHKVEVNAAMRVSFDDVFAPIETSSIASDNYDDMFVE